MANSPSDLALPRNVPVDGNWYDPERIQVTVTGRPTERQAIAREAYGDVIAATYATLYQNGQMVDDRHMLMCSHKECRKWKPDSAFDRCASAKVRRGRHWYCKECRAKHRTLFQSPEMDDATIARLVAGSKRRKKK